MTPFAPWQQRVYDAAAAALDAGRLGHGLLLCGPRQLGKRAIAERLAQRLLCESRGADGEPCGACRGCRLFAAGTHPDFHLVSFIPTKDGSKLRTEIVIEQVRELSSQLALTAQYGGAQIAVIDPADAINHAAANALLKTLEEPQPGRYLWLVCANPAMLPATIRSRCQRLEVRLPPEAEAVAWLRARGHGDAAKEALEAARGHPGLADAWLRSEGLALRRQVASDLARVERGELGVVETAQAWVADEFASLRLRHAADLAVAQASRGLTDPLRTRTLAAWFDSANRARDLLRTTVRADLVVADLLLAWRAGARAHSQGGRA